jgi:hypothetical protein
VLCRGRGTKNEPQWVAWTDGEVWEIPQGDDYDGAHREHARESARARQGSRHVSPNGKDRRRLGRVPAGMNQWNPETQRSTPM